MSSIVKISKTNRMHQYESQSHRIYPENWMGDGWLPVPHELEAAAMEYAPYCDLVIEDGALVDIVPTERPAPDAAPLKAAKITATKTALADYLAEHPLLWTDGKHYSVTAEKQALLNNALAVYQIGAQSGTPMELTWNATTEECTVWEFADLCALALGIAAYVKPLVAHQQALEAAIRAAETAEEVQAVEIDYAAIS